ncbi:hypothetical protein R1sor_021343 [Riccia sorocarpa]|uniref:F-box domain-containing protein n=1 Tax=Riccia sorocarpa TaxID=122646 RepID=A0ABD3GIN1_9MARC
MSQRWKDCRLVGKKPNFGGKMSIVEDGRGEDAMDPRLWGQLPHEILLAVLAWLPLPTLARLRVVSKSWSTMWSCPVFMQLRARIAPPESYDYQVLATARGLLLCRKRPPRIYSLTSFWPEKDNKSLHMTVCNPLRENCEVALPERIGTWRPSVVGMIGGEGNTYKVILASSMYGTEIYDSCSRRWKLIPRSDVRNGLLSPGFNPSVICHNGCMLYVGRSLRRGDAAAVFLFDGDTEQWSSFDLPVSGVKLQSLQLQDCGGRLFLAGHMTTMTEYRHFLCSGDVFVWERVGEDIVKGVWERRFSPDPQYPSHFPVLPSPEGTAFLARIKPDDLLCYSRATFGAVEHDNNSEHLSLYSVTSNCWWSSAEGRVCTHDSSKNRFRFSGGVGVPYRCVFDFEPRIESLP